MTISLQYNQIEGGERLNEKENIKELLENAPDWVMGMNSIDEISFGADFLKRHPMLCINDRLFDVNGEVDTKYIGYRISQEILP